MVQDSRPNPLLPVEPDPIPWYVHRWYWPGMGLGTTALLLLCVSPWITETGRLLSTAGGMVLIGGLLTWLYMARADAYDEKGKAVIDARHDVQSRWHSEQEYEHCHEHCSCSYCRTWRHAHPEALPKGSSSDGGY